MTCGSVDPMSEGTGGAHDAMPRPLKTSCMASSMSMDASTSMAYLLALAALDSTLFVASATHASWVLAHTEAPARPDPP